MFDGEGDAVLRFAQPRHRSGIGDAGPIAALFLARAVAVHGGGEAAVERVVARRGRDIARLAIDDIVITRRRHAEGVGGEGVVEAPIGPQEIDRPVSIEIAGKGNLALSVAQGELGDPGRAIDQRDDLHRVAAMHAPGIARDDDGRAGIGGVQPSDADRKAIGIADILDQRDRERRGARKFGEEPDSWDLRILVPFVLRGQIGRDQAQRNAVARDHDV
ncbi:hypothetical protein [Pseudoblastomonas halimionae]|uniref:Uncharacterized protein n=1 Tax=Alteriqipengyuania halimionae TaxID=1926630 RepID=A0A6I4U3N9_9SPHN|nr:hypothetical protein [Alteriqipengyuania halimionae]MXP10630.1 hypothetical protein [Alteriqipengyuania halimionae]